MLVNKQVCLSGVMSGETVYVCPAVSEQTKTHRGCAGQRTFLHRHDVVGIVNESRAAVAFRSYSTSIYGLY